MHISTRRKITSSLAMILVATLAMPASAQDVSLPGGANTLNETHGAWTVACWIVTWDDGSQTRRCTLSQTQIHKQTKKHRLTIELLPEGDGLNGTLMLPFGLALGPGVTFQLDEGAVGAVQHYRTCLSTGCLIDIAFDANTVASLKAGKVLNVNVTVEGRSDNKLEMPFPISLAGFSSAYDRVVELLQ